MFRRKFLFLTIFFLLPISAQAELPWEFDFHTRYMALGDSLVAGYGAVPATKGYVYLLYQVGAFDTVPNTLLSNAGVPGAMSRHVLEHQVPQAIEVFRPNVITITVGGNDLFRILGGADPIQVLSEFQANLTEILFLLRSGLPDTRIYLSNQYPLPEIEGSEPLILALNQIIQGVASAFGVPVADVYSAFLGRGGLLLIERHGAGLFEPHPTNAGYRVIAEAFLDVIE